jgi:hypothetical protein
MTKLFTTAKHWHIFILIFVLPFIAYVFMMANMFKHLFEMQYDLINKGIEPDPFIMFSQMKYFPIIMIAFTFAQFAWQWSVGSRLHAKLPSHVQMNLKVFKSFIIIPFVYTSILSIFLVSIFFNLTESSMIGTNGPPKELLNILPWIPLIMILHLFSIFCIFHSIYFIAKILKAVENQDNVTFGDYVAEFFMNWFLPVGIWFLQPRINKVFTPKEKTES